MFAPLLSFEDGWPLLEESAEALTSVVGLEKTCAQVELPIEGALEQLARLGEPALTRAHEPDVLIELCALRRVAIDALDDARAEFERSDDPEQPPPEPLSTH
jgi:hypothetical protein